MIVTVSDSLLSVAFIIIIIIVIVTSFLSLHLPLCVCVGVYLSAGVHVPECECGGQRATVLGPGLHLQVPLCAALSCLP